MSDNFVAKRMMKSVKQTIENIELLIDQGQGQKALPLIQSMTTKSLRPELNLKLATQARRLSRPKLALRLLRKHLVDHEGSFIESEPSSLAEYAISLFRVGLDHEATKIFDSLPGLNNPEVFLFQAFCHFSRWEYPQSIIPLQKYLGMSELSPKQVVIGKANLASAYINIQSFTQAQRLLKTLQRDAKKQGLTVLLGNSFEMQAQIAFREGNLKKAEEKIIMAQKILEEQGNLDSLFVKKWFALIQLQQKNSSQLLKSVFKQAKELHHYETLRSLDLEKAIILNSDTLKKYIHWGTPYPHFRSRINIQNVGQQIHFPKDSKLDPLNFNEVLAIFPDYSLPQKLLKILIQDFYRPFNLARLFQEIYPDEVFDPIHSPTKIYQLIKRTNRLLKNAGLSLKVQNDQHYYELKTQNKLVIRLEDKQLLDLANDLLQGLKEHFKENIFSLKEMADFKDWDKRKAQREILGLIKQEKVLKIGQGRSTFYRVL